MDAARARMVEEQLIRRGIGDPRVLDAFRSVPRERFVPAQLVELAYEDAPLPIGDDQTISQPYVVALTIEALGLRGGERVLEIGTGSGYAAALLGRIAAEVHTVERLASLADDARARLADAAATNVHVTVGDGSLGLAAHAPYDAIAVAAAGPAVPAELRAELAIGGRLVMPVAKDGGGQSLVRVTRTGKDSFTEEHLLDVTFVPLIGQAAWPEDRRAPRARSAEIAGGPGALLRRHVEPLDVERVVDRIGDARVVLLGGAVDGSLELQHLRVRLTRALLDRGGFAFVAATADFGDGARVDEHVRGLPARADLPVHAFARFADLRFRSRTIARFVDELRARGERGQRVAFHALDPYASSAAVALALERVAERDPEHAEGARARTAEASPWRRHNADLLAEDEALERKLVHALERSLAERLDAVRAYGPRAFEAARRAAEDGALYYRHMLRGSLDAWSLRVDAMANMLRALLDEAGPTSRAIVWAHDTEVADAAGADTGVRGHRTLGQLARLAWNADAYLVSLDAGTGSILAAPEWGAPARVTSLAPPIPESHEALLGEAMLPALALPIRGAKPALREALRVPRWSRAIGPVYARDHELVTHYLAVAPALAFDESLFVLETAPLDALPVTATCEPEGAHPFG